MPDSEYFYRSYGLKIRSEKPILEFTPSSEEFTPDLTLSWRSTAFTPDYSAKDWYFECDNGQAALCFQGVGIFQIPNTQTIIVTPDKGADERMVQRYLSGVVMAVLLHLQDFVVFHASCVTLHKQTSVAFIGDSGAGKSTLAALLHLMGHPCMNDDVTPIQVEASTITAIPGLPYVKIEQQFARTYNISPSILRSVHPDESEVYLPTHLEDNGLPRDIGALIFLQPGKEQSLQRMSQRQAMMEIIRYTLPARLLLQTGSKEHFFRSMRIAQEVPAYSLTRSHASDSREQLADLVLHEFAAKSWICSG